MGGETGEGEEEACPQIMQEARGVEPIAVSAWLVKSSLCPREVQECYGDAQNRAILLQKAVG